MELPKFYYNSRRLAAIYLFVVLLWLVMSGFATYLISTHGLRALPWFGWVFFIFFGSASILFGVAAFALAKRAFLSLPRLKISCSGVTDYTQKIGEILWSDIEKAYLRSTGKSTFICLELRDLKKYQDRVPRLTKWLNRPNRALGFTPITLNLTGVKADSQEIINAIKVMVG